MGWLIYLLYVLIVFFFINSDFLVVHGVFFIVLIAVYKFTPIKSCKKFYAVVKENLLGAVIVSSGVFGPAVFFGLEHGFSFQLLISLIGFAPLAFVVGFMGMRAMWR